MTIYDHLLNGLHKYNSDKIKICESIFKCNPNQIHKKVIIAPTWEVDIFDPYVKKINLISGPTGHGYTINEIEINGQKITYISTGIGACNILDATLGLGCTQCEEIIFIGAAGALDINMRIGDIVIPEYSICGVGADRYLTFKSIKNNDFYGKKYFPNEKLLTKLINTSNDIIKEKDIKMYTGQTYSIDTIFAQYSHLNEIISMGCNSIEMETATFFNASNCINIKSAAIFGISDNTLAKKSLYYGITDMDLNRKMRTKKNIIPLITLKALNLIK